MDTKLFQIYSNVILMATKYRKLTLITPRLEPEKFKTEIGTHAYVIITAQRKADELRDEVMTFFVIIAPSSLYAKTSGQLEKLFGKITRDIESQHITLPIDIMVITEFELGTNMIKMIARQSAAYPERRYDYFTYDIFLIELPQHVLVPPHELISSAEINAFCEDNHTIKQNLPLILRTDPQAVWLGLKSGMCVKITRPSETTCTAITYRYCP
jgi:DNA-directed RNA polymerase subunit H (RpoH/RPB5)